MVRARSMLQGFGLLPRKMLLLSPLKSLQNSAESEAPFPLARSSRSSLACLMEWGAKRGEKVPPGETRVRGHGDGVAAACDRKEPSLAHSRGLARNFRSNISLAFSRRRDAASQLGWSVGRRPQFWAGEGLLFVLFCSSPSSTSSRPGWRLIGLACSFFEIIPTSLGTPSPAARDTCGTSQLANCLFLGARVAALLLCFVRCEKADHYTERYVKTNPTFPI